MSDDQHTLPDELSTSATARAESGAARTRRHPPQVDQLLRRDDVRVLVEQFGRRPVVDTLRQELETARQRWLDTSNATPADFDEDHLVTAASDALQRGQRQRLTRVINATGVVLHTNLGRAPLSDAARQAVVEAAGYTTVELDLATGRRGSRTAALGSLAAQVAGTQAATVVNNGAAALILVLAALATDRETVVSRGELVEIGGSYRLPDIMEVSGSRMVEVGTTNRTRLSDYQRALGAETALLLKVHRSNFSVIGFTADVALGDLCELGRSRGVPVVYDLGSGLARLPADHPLATGPLAGEPTVADAVAAGADLVIFSGDKLLGGPQAGIIAGDADLVRRCTEHPLARALRVDKLQRAALEATLDAHLRSDLPVDLPVIAMLATDPEQLAQRAEQLAADISDGARALATRAVVGGGALPGAELDSWGVMVPADDADAMAQRLRDGAVPVIGRIDDGGLILDIRTVPPSQDAELADLVRAARTPRGS